MRVALSLLATFLLFLGCQSQRPLQVQNQYEARMDSTSLFLQLELGPREIPDLSGYDRLDIEWIGRCPGEQKRCDTENMTVAVVFVGQEQKYGLDTKLEFWVDGDYTGYRRTFSTYISNEEVELTDSFTGQRLEYTVPTDTVLSAAERGFKVGVKGEREGNKFQYTMTPKQQQKLLELVRRLS